MVATFHQVGSSITGNRGSSAASSARSASEALVDVKLEQIAALRATDADDEARRLLYEVLSEGNPTQVKVARNILDQMDS